MEGSKSQILAEEEEQQCERGDVAIEDDGVEDSEDYYENGSGTKFYQCSHVNESESVLAGDLRKCDQHVYEVGRCRHHFEIIMGRVYSGCPYVFKQGKYKGKQCTRIIGVHGFCRRHAKPKLPSNAYRCSHMYTRGICTGMRCNLPSHGPGEGYCTAHAANLKRDRPQDKPMVSH